MSRAPSFRSAAAPDVGSSCLVHLQNHENYRGRHPEPGSSAPPRVLTPIGRVAYASVEERKTGLRFGGKSGSRFREKSGSRFREKIRLHFRGRAALQRRVTRSVRARGFSPGARSSGETPETTRNSYHWARLAAPLRITDLSDSRPGTQPPLCGKSAPQPGIKPVIARDTTYSVCLLTGTIGRSNFAFPST